MNGPTLRPPCFAQRESGCERRGLRLEPDSAGVIGAEFIGDDDNAAGAVVMFDLTGGLILDLYPRSELAKDAQVPSGREYVARLVRPGGLGGRPMSTRSGVTAIASPHDRRGRLDTDSCLDKAPSETASACKLCAALTTIAAASATTGRFRRARARPSRWSGEMHTVTAVWWDQ